MKRLSNLATALAALALFFLCFPPRAYAYLDLGTGSLLVQILVAFLLGAGVAIKLFWKNIRAFFLRLTGRSPEVEEGSSAVAEEEGQPEAAGPPIPNGGGSDQVGDPTGAGRDG